jgi:hypothetical protein
MSNCAPGGRGAEETNFSWWRFALMRFYESLTRADERRAADLIFVMAGRMERRQYGLDLFQAGLAPKLVLSVGRFEVRKMRKLNLEKLDELVRLRDETPPNERHFFVRVDASGVRIEKAGLPHWNTYGEGLALRRLIEMEKTRRVIVVSTDVHLRRVSLTLDKVCRGIGTEFLYCAVPSHLGFFSKEDWWSSPDSRWFVINEMIKLTGYRLILSMPAWAARWSMRLRDDLKKHRSEVRS